MDKLVQAVQAGDVGFGPYCHTGLLSTVRTYSNVEVMGHTVRCVSGLGPESSDM